MSTRHSRSTRCAARWSAPRAWPSRRRAAASCCAPAARRSSWSSTSMQARTGNGGDVTSQFLLSDVQVLVEQTVNGVTDAGADDLQRHRAPRRFASTRRIRPSTTTPLNAVTITRYRVDVPPHRRTQHAGRRRAVRVRRRRRPSTIAAGGTGDGALRTDPSSGEAGAATAQPGRARRPGVHLDDRRDNVLRSRPERQRDDRSLDRIDVQFGDFGDE